MAEQIDLEDWLSLQPSPQIGGATYVPSLDRERLGEQYLRVWDLMIDGQWRSLRQISDATGDPEASVSARLRDVRKDYGTDAMQARRVPGIDGRRGHWHFRLNFSGLPARKP